MAFGEMPDRGASSRGAGSTSTAPSSIRSALRSLLSLAETRARLAANELEEQGLRLLEVIIWAAVALLFFAIALLLVSFFIVLVFWDSNRLLAAGLVAAFFISGGTVCLLMVRSGLAARPKFMAATLAELQKDRQQVGIP
jgi:uncharacterized membrane protein YqjE